MGDKYIIEKHEKDSIWRMYADAYGDVTVEGVDLTPYTEPDMERVREDAFKNGYDAACKDIDIKSKTNAAYRKGLEDAWEAARKIEFGTKKGGIPTDTIAEIFGTLIPNRVLRDFTAAEVIEKLKAYEQEQKEFKVGDEVIPRETEYDTMIVTRLWKDDYDSDCIDAIGFDGRISSFLVSRVSKTGKHYEIAEALQKMKES